MKTLLLIRHAKSSWDHPGLDDFDRPLNARGKRDAPLMASVLGTRDLRPDRILSSPARRALKTARLFADELGYDRRRIDTDPKIYENGCQGLLNSIRETSDTHGVLFVFGHNPDISTVARNLTGEEIGDMPTCAVVCCELDVESWVQVSEGSARLVFYDLPRNQG